MLLEPGGDGVAHQVPLPSGIQPGFVDKPSLGGGAVLLEPGGDGVAHQVPLPSRTQPGLADKVRLGGGAVLLEPGGDGVAHQVPFPSGIQPGLVDKWSLDGGAVLLEPGGDGVVHQVPLPSGVQPGLVDKWSLGGGAVLLEPGGDGVAHQVPFPSRIQPGFGGKAETPQIVEPGCPPFNRCGDILQGKTALQPRHYQIGRLELEGASENPVQGKLSDGLWIQSKSPRENVIAFRDVRGRSLDPRSEDAVTCGIEARVSLSLGPPCQPTDCDLNLCLLPGSIPYLHMLAKKMDSLERREK